MKRFLIAVVAFLALMICLNCCEGYDMPDFEEEGIVGGVGEIFYNVYGGHKTDPSEHFVIKVDREHGVVEEIVK